MGKSLSMKLKFGVELCLLSLCLSLLLSLALVMGCQNPGDNPGMKYVSIFFDDGWLNPYDVALPILLEYNFKATFAIVTREIGGGLYLGEEELNELAEYGMDIASHSINHPHLTADLTDQQLYEEIVDSKKHLEEMGFTIRTFVYPYYQYNDRVLSCVKNAGYVCARSGGKAPPYDLETTDSDARYHISSAGITDQTLEQFKTIVDEADEHTVVVLHYHLISDTGPESTSTPVNNFREQMRYLYEAGFIISLLPDLIR